jgi:hypothetical protein
MLSTNTCYSKSTSNKRAKEYKYEVKNNTIAKKDSPREESVFIEENSNEKKKFLKFKKHTNTQTQQQQQQKQQQKQQQQQ